MGMLLAYSLAVGIALIPLYFVIKLGLSGTTFHSFNRRVILVCYAVALMFPFLLGVRLPESRSAAIADVTMEFPEYAGIVADAAVKSDFSLWVVVGLYGVGVLFFIAREVFIAVKMCRLMSSCENVEGDSRWRIMLHGRDDVAPFSWANRIVMSQKDYLDGGKTIVAHESAHLERYHSLDLLLAEAVTILAWYNPAAWLMREELSTVHEYETDEAILRQGFNARDYQLLLIKKAVGSRFPSIANSLDHSNLSKRIKMMLQKKTSPGRRWIAAAALPAVALSAVMLSTRSVASTLEEISDAKVTEIPVNNQVEEESLSALVFASGQEAEPLVGIDSEISAGSVYDASRSVDEESAKIETPEVQKTKTMPTEKDKNVLFTQVENRPQYPGGDEALFKFIKANMIYPEKALKDSITGRVIVKFVVKKDGSIGDVKVLRGRHPLLDAEAVRVVKEIKYMNPGTINSKPVNVSYVLPISFKVTDEKSKAKEFTADDVKDKVFTAVEKMPQYPGGNVALMEDMMKNLKYPEDAGQGRVIVQFVVTSTGSVGMVKVVRGVSPELDKAAVDAVKTLRRFEPGLMNGVPVNVWYTLPVAFKQEEVTAKEE